MRIIIVDDHVIFREGLAAILHSEPDIEVVGLAGAVGEAVDIVSREKPDLVLMDFGLPDGTGADATRQILDVQPDTKVVFLTMSEEDDDLLAAIRSGAKGYLLKNMRPAKLVASLRSVMKGESALSRTMTLRLMQELAKSPEGTPPADPQAAKLTNREMDVLKEIAIGLTNQEIAHKLFLSENTIKYHVHSILEKLGLPDRKSAAAYARERNLL